MPIFGLAGMPDSLRGIIRQVKIYLALTLVVETCEFGERSGEMQADAADLIEAGKVKVNGMVIKDPGVGLGKGNYKVHVGLSEYNLTIRPPEVPIKDWSLLKIRSLKKGKTQVVDGMNISLDKDSATLSVCMFARHVGRGHGEQAVGSGEMLTSCFTPFA